MKKNNVVLLFFCVLLYTQSARSEAIITLYNGTVVYLIDETCKELDSLPANATCYEGTLIMKGMGGVKKWVKEQYTPHTSRFKIKKGKVKIVDGEKILFYRNWFFGKKINIGIVE